MKTSPFAAAVAASVALAALWIVLALLRPGTTFHFAPLLVAGAAPVVATTGAVTPRSAGAVVGITALAAGTALFATIALDAAEALEGPSLLPFGGACTESVLFVGLGGAGGPVAAIAHTRRFT